MKLWPCKPLDISARDLGFAIRRSFSRMERRQATQVVEAMWGSTSCVVTLTARSAFDLFLRVKQLPQGSEIIFSGVNIPDMAKIAERHGLRPVGIDIDPRTTDWHEHELEQLIGPKTRAVVFAHLFGTRRDLHSAIKLAHRHNLLFIEDCAQTYAGDNWRGNWNSDIRLFSFGPVKTATALGGAIAEVRDEELLRAMVETYERYPVQSRSEYRLRILKYALLHFLSQPLIHGLSDQLLTLIKIDRRQLTQRWTRNVVGNELLTYIRRQPCAGLLNVLASTLRDGTTRFTKRVHCGQLLLEQIQEHVCVPGRNAVSHGFWMIPILCDDPSKLQTDLYTQGFDALPARLACIPHHATDLIGAKQVISAVCIPFGPNMPATELKRLASIVNDVLDTSS